MALHGHQFGLSATTRSFSSWSLPRANLFVLILRIMLVGSYLKTPEMRGVFKVLLFY
jgi:hypothetical protein